MIISEAWSSITKNISLWNVSKKSFNSLEWKLIYIKTVSEDKYLKRTLLFPIFFPKTKKKALLKKS